jgi:predicted N-acyltransferase
MPPIPLEIEVIHDIRSIPEAEWNRLVSPDDPFTDHRFLAALEESQSVGQKAGWLPVHLAARRAGVLVDARPLYLKNNSYGEYIFDWGWAEAAHRAGIAYYPKLVSAVPFTPASGRRLLTDDPAVQNALIDATHSVADVTNAHSTHLLFVTEKEHQLLCERTEFTGRVTHQFHWNNDGYTDFEGWLSSFRSRRRKEIRRERRAAASSEVEIHMLRGPDLTAEHWASLREFYEDTTSRKHAEAYLSRGFFEIGADKLQDTALAFMARVNEQWVAGALCFQKGEHLYGRYWGCLPGWNALHFECCYHAPIEACIHNGWHHFEAGAQGAHKIQRGLVPVRTWSAHHLRHPGLSEAVAGAMGKEARLTEHEINELSRRAPFRRDDAGSG